MSGPLHILGGALGSLSSCVLLQPLDLAKTRMQQERLTSSPLFNTIKSALTAPSPHPPQNPITQTFQNLKYLSQLKTLQTMNSVIQSDGVAGLWRGTIPTIFRNVPGSAVYFWSLNEIRQALMIVRWVPSGNEKAGLTSYHGNSDLKFKGLSPDSINLIAGASARTFAGFVLMPISVIKTRFESNHYQYSSIFAASSAIWKKEGVYGLFRGFSATALRDSPYAGLYLLFYERSRAFFGPWAHPQSPYHALTTAISGGVSGVLASVLTNPFDVVKTRMQVNPEKYPGFWKTVGKVLKDEGFAGFAGGLGPRLARKVIAAAITWTIYEEVMLLFAPKNQS